jgi:hypothetical protein
MNLKARLTLTLFVILMTASLYAEGALVNGWIEVGLVAPVIWFIVSPRTSRPLQNLVLALGATCLTVTAADLLLRPVLGPYLYSTPMNAYTRKKPELPVVGRWDANVSVTGEAYGDLAAMTGDSSLRVPHRITFTTDAAGFRNEAIRPPIEVLVLGDSFGAGASVTQEKTVSQLLQAQYGWSTYNLSFPASGPWHQYVNLAIEASHLMFAPHAVVVWLLYTGNDLDDEYGSTWSVEELPWRSTFAAWQVSYKTFRGRSPIHQITDNLSWRIKKANDMKRNVIKASVPDGSPVLFLEGQEAWGRRVRGEVEQHPSFPKLIRTMEEMKRLIAARGLRLFVAVLPTKGEIYRGILEGRDPLPNDSAASGFSQAVLGACEKLRLACVDPKPWLIQESKPLLAQGEMLWWRDDTHLSEQGHESLARFIARELHAAESLDSIGQDGHRRK